MIVEEIMTANPAHVEASSTVGEALELLYSLDVRHVPVTEDGTLIGLLSDRDLRSFSLPDMVKFANPQAATERLSQPVSELMRGGVVSVGTQDEVSEVVRLMIDHKYGAIPVVDKLEGGLVGIVSYVDVLRAVEDQL